MINEIEIAVLISVASLIFGIYSGVSSMRRNARADSRKDASEMAMVIVKLEDISSGISEIKTDLSNVKGDIKDITERLIVAEQSLKSAHKRIEEIRCGQTENKKYKERRNENGKKYE